MANHPTPMGEPGQSSDDILGREPGGTDELGPRKEAPMNWARARRHR